VVIAIFRSRVAKEHGDEFERRYAEMSELVEAIPGYGTHERFTSANGEDVLVVEFLTKEAFLAWDTHPEHKKSQDARQRIYFRVLRREGRRSF